MGVAIIGVMLGHLMNHTIQPPILPFVARMVHTLGFLFLSGFGLYYSFSKDNNIFNFYKKRVSRLYIPYFIIASIFFITLVSVEHKSILQFIGYITTAAFWYEGNYYAMWYVAISLVLYIIYPIIHNFTFKNESQIHIRLIIVLILFLSVFIVINFISPSYWSMIKFGLAKSFIFPIGMYVGYLSKIGFDFKRKQTILYFIACIFCMIIGKKIDSEAYGMFRALFGIPIFCFLLNYIDNKAKALNSVCKF